MLSMIEANPARPIGHAPRELAAAVASRRMSRARPCRAIPDFIKIWHEFSEFGDVVVVADRFLRIIPHSSEQCGEATFSVVAEIGMVNL